MLATPFFFCSLNQPVLKTPRRRCRAVLSFNFRWPCPACSIFSPGSSVTNRGRACGNAGERRQSAGEGRENRGKNDQALVHIYIYLQT